MQLVMWWLLWTATDSMSRPLWQVRLIHYSNRDLILLSAVVSIPRQISTASAPNGSAIQSLPMMLPVIAFRATANSLII